MIRRSVVLLSMLAVAGTALAQTPPAPPPSHQWHGHHQWKDAAQWQQKMEQRRMDRLAILLDLTSTQRQQLQTIFASERATMKPAMEQVRQAMKQARAAHEAARKDTRQRLASVLSPTQMKKLEVLMPKARMMHAMMMHRMMMHGMGHGMKMGQHPMPGPGSGSAPQ